MEPHSLHDHTQQHNVTTHRIDRNEARLEILPPEMIQQICKHIDDSSLRNLQLVCRDLRKNSYYIFGRRFFTTLKVFVHSTNLRILLQILDNHSLAKHIQYLIFGVENHGFLDRHVSNLDLIPQAKLMFGPPSTFIRNSWDIEMGFYMFRVLPFDGIINRVLRDCPKLTMIMIGDNHAIDRNPARDNSGNRPESSLYSTGYYRYRTRKLTANYIYALVTIALGTQRPEIKLALNIKSAEGDPISARIVVLKARLSVRQWTPVEDSNSEDSYSEDSTSQHAASTATSTIPNMLIPTKVSASHRKRAHRLHILRLRQLELHFNQKGPRLRRGGTSFLCKTRIDTLTITYDMFSHPRQPRPGKLQLFGYTFRYLKNLTLKDGWCSSSGYAEFLEKQARTIRRISLINLSVGGPRDLDQDWVPVIEQLQTLPHLCHLHLESLSIEDRSTFVPPPPNFLVREVELTRILDPHLSKCATWTNKQEIATGLEQLLHAYRGWGYQHVLTGQWRTILHLRYANFEASPRYGWTAQEAACLVRYADEWLVDDRYCDDVVKGFAELPSPGLDDRNCIEVVRGFAELPYPDSQFP